MQDCITIFAGHPWDFHLEIYHWPALLFSNFLLEYLGTTAPGLLLTWPWDIYLELPREFQVFIGGFRLIFELKRCYLA